jgi:S-adenosylmethionine:tRNA ribosyltransferase-isomerase
VRLALVTQGTTSVRTLESLYWHGTKLLGLSTRYSSRSESLANFGDGSVNFINQWEAYAAIDDAGIHSLPTAQESFTAAADQAGKNGDMSVAGVTRMLIVPGYPFQVCVRWWLFPTLRIAKSILVDKVF